MKLIRLFAAFLVLTWQVLFAGPSTFADQIWDGGGADANWNTAANWGADTLPNFANAITFTGNTRNGAVNNVTADSVIGGINFTNTGATGLTNAFTLSGNRITLGGNITTTANAANTTTITDIISLAMILNGNRTFTTNQNSATLQHNLTVSGVISETGGARTLTKAGGGTLTLSGANSYTGATNVNAGLLIIQNATALGTTAGGTLVANNAALAIQGGITVGAEALTLNGTGISNGGAFRNISGANNYGGLVTLGSASRINSDAGTLTLSNTGTITGAFGLVVGGSGNTVINSIIGTGSGTLSKDGTGTLTLNGINTFSGGTTISAGTLALGNASDTLLNTGAVIVDGSTAVLSLGANSDTVGAVTLRNGASITGSTGVLSGSSYAVESGTVSAILGGSGALTKTTAGVVSLSGANTYTGGSTITSGALSFLNTNAKAASGTHAFGAGTTLGLGVAASGSFFTTADVDNAFANNMIGNLSGITLDAATNIGIDTTAGDFAYSLIGSSSRGLSKLGTNTLALTGTNAYSGPTNIFAGTLSANSSDALGDGSATNTLVFSGGTLLATGAIASPSLRTVNMAGTGIINTNGNSVSIAGSVSGTGGLTKFGAGTLTLSGLSGTSANNYSGTTTINEGTVALTNPVGQSLTGGLTFGSTAATTTTGTLDLTNASATFNGATLAQTNSATGNTIIIGSGNSLTSNGNVTIGASATGTNGRMTVSATTGNAGTGSWNVAGGGAFSVGGSATVGSTNTLDMRATGLELGTFTAGAVGTPLTVFRIGSTDTGSVTDTNVVRLANTATITATTMDIGASTFHTSSNTLTIGTGSGASRTTFNANTINIGSTAQRGSGTINFADASLGELRIRAADGISPATINLVNSNAGTGSTLNGNLLLAGHSADVLAGAVTMQSRTGALVTTTTSTSTLTFDAGTFTSSSLVMANRASATVTTGNMIANATFGGGTTSLGNVTMSQNGTTVATTTGGSLSTLTFNGNGNNTIASLNMGNNLSTATTASGNPNITDATLNLSGTATTTITGNLNMAINAGTAAAAATTARSTINLSAGSFRVNGNIAMGDVTVDGKHSTNNVINVTGGTLTVDGNITRSQTVAPTTGTQTTSINLNGGVLDMTAGNIGGPGAGVIGLTYTDGVLKNLGTVSGGITLAGSGSRLFDQDIGVSGTVQGTITGVSLGLTKQGLGSLAFAGTNTYAGSTLVSGGTLAVSGTGAINTSSGITIDGSSAKLLQTGSVAISPTVTLTNGTLTGNGTVNTVNVGDGTGGIISNNDGVSGGALTIGNLTLAGAANLNLFSGPLTSNLNVTGALTTAATPATLTANNVNGWTNGATYTILNFGGGAIAGSGDNFIKLTNNLTARQAGTWNTSTNAITLDIVGDNPKWTGRDNGNWQLGTTGANENWQLVAAATPTTFLTTDDVVFDDTATGTTTVSINAANVLPNTTNFNNSNLNYTMDSTGGFGIANGILTKSGSGSLTINTANTYAGATTLNAGTLVLGNASAIGTGNFTIAGGSLDSSVANLVNTGNNAQTWNTDINFIGTQSLNLGTGAVTMNANRAVTVGANTLTVGGAIGGGAVSLTKNGVGTLALTAANTYSGGTTINAGTLSIGNATALGANTGVVSVASGAALDLNGTVMTGTNALALNGSGISSSGALVNSSATAATYAGAVTLGSSTTIIPGSGNISLSSTLGMGANALTKSGANALTLNGVVSGTKTVDTVAMQINAGTVVAGVNTNTFNGDIAVDGAGSVFQVNTGATYTTTAPWGTVAGGTSTKQMLLTNGGAFRLASGTLNVNNVTATNIGAGIIFNLGTGGGVLDVAGGATLIIDDGAATGTGIGAAQIQGAGSITKIGTGILQIDDSTAYAGNIIVNAGLLQPASGNAFGTTVGNTTINSGAALNLGTIAMTNPEPLTLSGTGLASAPAGALTTTGVATTATWVGPITIATGGATIGGGAGQLTLASGATVDLGSNTLTFNHAARIFTNGVISGAGAVIVNGSTGDYIGSAAHTYTGGTTINAGSTAVPSISSVGPAGSPISGPFGAGPTPLVLNGGSLRSGTLAAYTIGNTVTLAADTTFITTGSEKSLIFSGPVTITGASRVLTSNVGTTVAGTSTVFSGPIGDGGNGLGITKAGSGNLILSGPNTYTGPTVVNAGVLNVTNTQTSLGLTVAPTALSGATYSLNSNSANALSGLTTLNLGSIAGPTTIGLDLGSLSDSITTANAATATGAINFNIMAIAGFTAGNYSLINAASGLTSSTPTYSLTSAPGGFTYGFTNSDSQVQLNVVASAATDVFWRGGVSNSWNNPVAINGNNTNWFTDASGTTNAQINPGPGQFVNFSNTNATGPISTTLDNNTTVQGLRFTNTGLTVVTIASGSLTPSLLSSVLTLAPTASSDGITLSQGSGLVTISAPIALGSTQTWSVDSSAPGSGTASSLIVSGAISGEASNGITFTTTAGTTPIILSSVSGPSTYSGGSTVSASTILQGGATNAFSTNTAWTVNGTLNTGAFSQSTGSLVGGNGIVQNGSATNATLSIGNDNLGSPVAFAGTIQNGSTGTLAITKTGTGTQALSGANTYSGGTTIQNGVLALTGGDNRLLSTGTVTLGTVATSGKLVLGDATAASNQTLAGLLTTGLGGNVVGGNATTDSVLTINNGAANVFGGTLGGVGANENRISLIKSGAGDLTLGGNNTYDGTTTVNAGTLTITNNNALGSTVGSTTINGGNGTGANSLSLNSATSGLTIAENINLFGNAAGRAQVTNNSAFDHTFTGAFDVSSATNLAQFNSNGTGSITVSGDITGTLSSGAVLFLRGSSTNALNRVSGSLNLTGGDLAKTDAGTWIVGAPGKTYSWNNTLVAVGTLRMGLANVLPNSQLILGNATGASTGTLDLNGFDQTLASISYNGVGASTGTRTITSSAGAAVLTVGNATDNPSLGTSVATNNVVLTGSLGLTKVGAGRLILPGVNTNTGRFVVNQGTLQFGLAASLYNNTPASWTAANINVQSGATLALNVGDVGQFTSGDVDTLLTNISIANSTAEGLQSGAILGFDTTTRAIAAGTFTQGNVIADSTGTNGGAIGITKLGLGTLTLDKANTYSGGTTVNSGTIIVNTASSMGAASGTLTVTGSSTVQLAAAFDTARNYNLNAGVLTVDTQAFNQTNSGTISGVGSLAKSGSGTLTLSGTNTYTGTTSVGAGGVLVAGSTSAFGVNSAVTVASLATLRTNGFSNSIGSLAGAGLVENASATAATLTVGSDNTNTTFTGLIQDGVGGGALSLLKVGTGTLILTNTNTFTGANSVATGSRQVAGSTQAFGVNSAVTVTGTLQLAGFSNSVGSLSGGGTVENANVAAATFTTGGNNASTVFSGIIQDGIGGGAISVIKSGTGSFELTGANTYTGPTSVNGGTMLVNNTTGSGTGTGAVTVASGATLGGTGTIGGDVNFLSGAIYNPGNSPGLQTLAANATFNGGSVFNWELTGNTDAGRGVTFDGVDVTGTSLNIATGAISNLVFNGVGSTVAFADSFWDNDRQWLVFDNANAPTVTPGIFGTVTLSTDSTGQTLTPARGSFAWTSGGNDILLSYTAVAIPEPGTLALLGLVGAASILIRRRRRQAI